MNTSYYSHGKLLLTAEYLVLDGAKALAVPTKKGQKLEVKSSSLQVIHWKSILADSSDWIDEQLPLPLDSNWTGDNPLVDRLYTILISAQKLNPSFLKGQNGFEITSTLEFPKNWGLGSSSTLIANIARWANVNPYQLLENTFGGSGYDIACANALQAITFKRGTQQPLVEEVSFEPDFKENLFFIYLNRKQNSRESINHYRSLDANAINNEVKVFSEFTENMISCTTLSEFESILNDHENRLSGILRTPTIKSQLFSNYPHAIKSLGGWGGDFILAVGSTSDMDYFKKKGYKTFVPYSDMVL